jgi:hypothetical protein
MIGRRQHMLDLPRAMRVTEDCIRLTADLFPPADHPFGPETVLLRLGIDNTRIDLLKMNIAGDERFGLPSLTPKRRIDISLITIDETSTVFDVFVIVADNTVLG